MDKHNRADWRSTMPSALIYGCNGALGAAVVRHLRTSMPSWSTIGVDVADSSAVHYSVAVDRGQAMFPSAQAQDIISSLDRNLGQGEKKLDAILCVSGGFAMGDAKVTWIVCYRGGSLLRLLFCSLLSSMAGTRTPTRGRRHVCPQRLSVSVPEDR